MNAHEETGPAAADGKSTRGSSRLSAGEATRMLMLHQLPYADAVHAELLTAGMPPAFLEAGVRYGSRGAPELYLRAVWPAGTVLLEDVVRRTGLTIAWSHVTGWSAHDAYDRCLLLDVDVLADPSLIAHAALHLAGEPLDGGARWTSPPGPARWSEAVYLDIALAAFDERPVT